MRGKDIILIGGLLGAAYLLTKKPVEAAAQAASEQEPIETTVETTAGTAVIEITSPRAAVNSILAPGAFKIGTIGGLTGIWYNPSDTLDFNWLQAVSAAQNQPLRDITSAEPLIQQAVAAALAQSVGYIVKAW